MQVLIMALSLCRWVVASRGGGGARADGGACPLGGRAL
jgi:hypothetical protein